MYVFSLVALFRELLMFFSGVVFGLYRGHVCLCACIVDML